METLFALIFQVLLDEQVILAGKFSFPSIFFVFFKCIIQPLSSVFGSKDEAGMSTYANGSFKGKPDFVFLKNFLG